MSPLCDILLSKLSREIGKRWLIRHEELARCGERLLPLIMCSKEQTVPSSPVNEVDLTVEIWLTCPDGFADPPLKDGRTIVLVDIAPVLDLDSCRR